MDGTETTISPSDITSGLAAQETEEAATAAPQSGPQLAPPQTPPAPETPAAPQPGAAPWAKDLDGLGLGELTGKVDEYLRSSWQPRMTQLEQDIAAYNEMFGGDHEAASTAAAMFQAFQEDPETAFQQLGHALGYFGEDDGQKVQAPNEAQSTLQDDPRMQWIDQQMAAARDQENQKILDDYLNEVGQTYGEGFNRDAYNAFFVASGGDEARAKELYAQIHQQAAPPTAPAVLNDTTGSAPGTPQREEPATIDDAMAEFLAEQKLLKSR